MPDDQDSIGQRRIPLPYGALLFAVVLALAVTLLADRTTLSRTSEGARPDGADGLQGERTMVHPPPVGTPLSTVAALRLATREARRHLPGGRLVSMTLEGVTSSGHLDLRRGARAVFVFGVDGALGGGCYVAATLQARGSTTGTVAPLPARCGSMKSLTRGAPRCRIGDVVGGLSGPAQRIVLMQGFAGAQWVVTSGHERAIVPDQCGR